MPGPLGQRISVKRVALLFILVATLLLEARLLWFDLPRHVYSEGIWVHIGVVVSVVLFPLTLLAILNRLPLGSRYLKKRFIVVPFQTTSATPRFNGTAIAALLFRGIQSWRSEASGHVSAETTPYAIPDQATFTLAGTSLPLEWIWRQLRRIVSGQSELIIEGVLEDADDPPRLRVWTDHLPDTWVEPLEQGRLAEALEKAIPRLSLTILRDLDPILVGLYYWQRGNYQEAIDLLGAGDRHDVKTELDLVQIHIECDQVEGAIRRLEHLRRSGSRIDASLRAEMDRLHAEALTAKGDLGLASEYLEHLLKRGRHSGRVASQLHWSLALANAYDRRFEAAIVACDKAEREVWREITELRGRGRVESFDELVNDWRSAAPPPGLTDLFWLLHEIHTAQARARKLTGGDPLPAYDKASQALQALRDLDYYPARDIDLSEAVICKAVAQHLQETNPQEAQRRNQLARQLYQASADSCRRDLQDDPDDTRTFVNLAWSQFGLFVCLHRMTVGTDTSERHIQAAAAAEVLAQLVRRVSSQKAERIEAVVLKAISLAAEDPSQCNAAVTKAATTLLSALLADLNPELVPNLVDDLIGLSEGPIGPTMATAAQQVGISDDDIQKALVSVTLPEAAQRFPDDMVEAFRVLLHLLSFVTRTEGADELIPRASWRTAMKEALEACDAGFNELWNLKERHYKAECAYGFACSAAVLLEADRAVEHLTNAIKQVSGEGKGGSYVNRARLDEDFDGIRADPEFHRLVYGS